MGTTPTNSISPAPRLSGKEREALINHLNNVDLATIEKLVLSPRQKLALTQELEYKRLGLPAFSDPTPWQKLTRDEQRQFNEKYLALRTELQDYSKVQFTSLPEERQEHAYKMFLHLDIDTLTQVINRELERQQEAQSLFENESLAHEFEEILLSENPHQELSLNLFTEIPETFQDSINIHTEVKPQKLVIRFDNSQENNIAEIAKPQQKFQISEQQLDQLQQQLDHLEESGQHGVQTSQDPRPSHQKTQQFQKLLLSPQHIQQIQQEIQLLEEPGRHKGLFDEVVIEQTENQEKISDLLDKTDQGTLDISDSPQLIDSSTEQEQQDYFYSGETESHSTTELNSFTEAQDQQPDQNTYEQSTQNPDQFARQQPSIVTNQQPTQQEAELTTQQSPQQSYQVNQQQLQQPDKLNDQHQKLQALISFAENVNKADEQVAVTTVAPVHKTLKTLPQTKEPVAERIIELLQIDPIVETFLPKSSLLKPILTTSKDRIKSPESIFFGQNKQIEELRKEFKLTAKQFSKKVIENKARFKNKAALTKEINTPKQQYQQPEKPAVQKWPSFPEVKQIKPQFLQPAAEITAQTKHNFLQSDQKQTFRQRLEDEANLSVETKNPFVGTIKLFDSPTQVFLQEPQQDEDLSDPLIKLQKISKDLQAEQSAETKQPFDGKSQQFRSRAQGFLQKPKSDEPFSDPIRQLQKISEDFKMRAFQPNPRVRSRPIFDPRIRQQQESRQQLQLREQPQGPTPAELKHFRKAEAQIAKAIRLQECINNPSSCQV